VPADRLTALDSSFLHLEDASSHMHVASVTIFEGPPPTYEEFLEHIDARLSLVPRYRQKLRFVPLNQGRPVWVDDPHFNLEYHVRATALPPPGSEEQLKNLASRVFAQQLDREKPLWEVWLVQGLERGEDSPSDAPRFALLSKTHHAMVDGVAGVDITSVLFDTAPEPETPPADVRWHPRPEPTSVQLLSEAMIERATQPAEILRTARAAFRAPRQIAQRALESVSAIGSLAKTGLAAPSSPLNVDIGPHRRYDWVRTDLNELKEIKDRLGGTVNDVVLAVVTGALRRFLEHRGEPVDEITLRAMVPVSVRRQDEYSQTMGNRVAAMMAPLPIYEFDPVERLHIIREELADLKQSGQAVGAQVLTQLSGMAPPTVMAQASRLQSRQRFFNLVVTNVPGPQIPLYVLGRRLLDLFPMAPLARRQALCIAVMSYNGKMCFGLLGDFDAMPDMRIVADGITESLDELKLAAGIQKRRRAPRRPAAARRAPAGSRSGSNGSSGDSS
jgi:diacylglycerol O-acyltransferase / wax synthase